tara:strand:- start:187 stop:372 length:186 start_codon:yes stop_codon:yes gene_type:complete
MRVDTLIKRLNQVKDKSLLVRVVTNNGEEDLSNYWINDIEVHNKNSSGYEQNGEVILIGEE